MRHDEFNHIDIKNVKDGFSSPNALEFGKTQKSESTSFKENKNEVRDELNRSTNRNNENVEIGKNQTNNNDLIDKMMKTTNNVSGASSTTSATGATTTASAAAASSAGATTASVAAGVSIVAVVGVSTLVGISVVSNNNASVQFKYLDIYPNSVNYVLNLYDTNDDHFSIHLENDNYLSYNDLVEGENEGNFSGLNLGETYRIFVQEDSQSGKIIYDEKITTTDNGSHSAMTGLVWDKTANFKTQSFTIKIDYYDSEEKYSDFQLSLSNGSITTILPLEATNEEQTVVVNPSTDYEVVDIRKDTLKYVFSFKENGKEVIYESGEVRFTDNSNGKVIFSDVNINPSADLLSNEFQVTLDYIDDFDYLDNFVLVITPSDGSLSSQRIELSKQTETQTVSLVKDDNWPGKLYGLSLDYYVEYTNDGETQKSEIKNVTFTDNQGRSQVIFNDVSIGASVDLLSDTFEVTLSYIDDFGLLDSFNLHYRPANTEQEFITAPLTKQTESQPITLQSGSSTTGGSSILYNLSLEYYVTYSNDGITNESTHKTVIFEDNQGRQETVFNGVTINESANLMGDTFEVLLDYTDEFGLLDNFVLYYKEVGSSAPETSCSLTKQITAQTVTLSLQQGMDVGEGTSGPVTETSNKLYGKSLSYYVTYTNNNQQITSPAKTVTFVDSQGREMSSFSDATINSSADLTSNTFSVVLDYSDDFELISDIYLNYRLYQSEDTYYRESLLKQTSAQTVTLAGHYGDTLMDLSLDYYVEYTIDGVAGSTTQKSVTFIDSQGRKPSALNDATINPSVDVLTNDIEVTLDYDDDYGFLDNFILYYSDSDAVTSDGYQEQGLFKQLTPQSTSVFVNMERLLDVTLSYYVECSNSYTGETLSTEIHTVSFVDAEGRTPTTFNGVSIDSQVDASSNVFEVTLDYSDDFGFLGDFILYYNRMDDPSTYNVVLDKTTDPQEVTLTPEIADNLYDLTIQYYISYTIEGEPYQTQKTEVMFFDEEGRSGPTFNDVTINPSVDVLGDTFEVTLDYVDYFNKLDNFTLYYSVQGSDVPEQTQELSKTTSSQSVIISSMFDVSKLYGLSLNYYVTYQRNGVLQTSSQKSVTFVDSQGRQETVFNDVIISPSVDILSNQVSVTLDYVDDYEFLSEFTLCYQDVSGGMLQSAALTKQTTAQTVSLTNYSTLEGVSIDYYVVYYEDGNQVVSDTNNVTFVDAQNRQSTLNGATISTWANFATKTIDVTLDYVDELNHFSQFEMTMYNDGSGAEGTFSLQKTTALQQVDTSDSQINIADGFFEITITCLDSSTGQTEQVYHTSEFDFQNSLTSEVNDIISDWAPIVYEPNQDETYYYLPVQLDYVDEGGIYTEFRMVINDMTDWPIYLEMTEDWQYADLTEYAYENDLYGTYDIAIYADTYSYIYEDVMEELVYQTSATITSNSPGDKIYGVQILSNEIVIDRGATFQVYLVMCNDSGTLTDFELTFKCGNTYYSVPMTVGSDYFITQITIDLSNEDDLLDYLRDNPCDIYVSYLESGVSQITFATGNYQFVIN